MKNQNPPTGEADWENIGLVAVHGTSTKHQNYSFVDKDVVSGNYIYLLKQIDFDGTYSYSKEIEIDVNIPIKFNLRQNYPNPFNPSTTIKYSIKNPGLVSLKVYDVLGNEVASLVNQIQQTGTYKVIFDASRLASGVYYYRLKTNGFVQTRKIFLTVNSIKLSQKFKNF